MRATFVLVLALAAPLALGACGDGSVSPASGSTTPGDAGNAADGQLGDGQPGDGGADATPGPGDTAAADDTLAADATGQDLAGADAADATAYKYATCSGLLLCAQVACGASAPDGCEDICLASASPAAQQAIAPYLTCVDVFCRQGLCKGSSDPQCMGKCSGEKCGAKMIACSADGQTGTGTCDTMFSCFETCKGGGPNCLAGCYAQLTAAAQADFLAFADCTASAGGKDPGSQCPEQYFKCLSGGQTGAKACWELLACTDACNALPAAERLPCIAGCYGQGTPAAQQQLVAVAKCFGGQGGDACLQSFVQCADPVGSKTCLDVIVCGEECKKAGKEGGVCLFECLHQASPAEAQATVALMVCVDQKCKACAGDKACEDACTQDKCKPQLDKCLGG